MKSVKVSELKAKLAKYLRSVKAGQELIVLDRNLPIAKLSKFEAGHVLSISDPSTSLRVALAKATAVTKSNKAVSLEVIVDERGKR